MPLAAGARIGHYEILEPIGEGGMGAVYRARDIKLKRDVALKVLPAAFARDPDRLARFQREAEVLASLNHPNIASIFGVERDETTAPTTHALAMEFVDGVSPAPANKAPLPFDEAWKICAQIADALSYAHDKGVIHRDLKPANVKVTHDGVVKLLDFGLAKAFSARTASDSGTPPPTNENSPTLTMGGTEVGMVLGTAAYMAPEQAKGKQVDKRADIWAFGVVLYELLTGERPFRGDDVGDILASVIKDTPNLEKIPAEARPLMESCLEKDAKKRLRDIGDAGRMLESPMRQLGANTGVGTNADLAPRRGLSTKLAWITAAVLALAAAGLGTIAYRATQPAPLKPLVRLDVDLGPDVSLPSGTAVRGTSTILSPDGSRLVYVSQRKLFTRRIDQEKATELPGTEGAESPFFSPDGQWVGFVADKKLKKISIDGGAAVALCDARQGYGGGWGADGSIIASLSGAGRLARIPADGGQPVPILEYKPGEIAQMWPQILPGGKAVLFTSSAYAADSDQADIEVVTLADHRRKIIHQGGTFGRYLAGADGAGYLLYVNHGTLFAVAFDVEKLEARGSPVPILDRVAYSVNSGGAEYAFAESGAGPHTLVYRVGGIAGLEPRTVQWLDSAGKAVPLLSKPDLYLRPRLSPDGDRLAFNTNDVWVYDIKRNASTRITFEGLNNAIWSPDGRFIVYRKNGEGILWTRSDAAGKSGLLVEDKDQLTPSSFSPDGKVLLYSKLGAGRPWETWVVPVENSASGLHGGRAAPVLQSRFNERQPSFSPDGRWFAYSSDEPGRYETYVRSWPDSGKKWQISTDSGLFARFAQSGRQLFFRSEDSRTMYVVDYSTNGDAFVPGKQRVWSETPLFDTSTNGANYDVAPDGKRIVALMPADTEEAKRSRNHVIVLENFVDELKRKVPAK